VYERAMRAAIESALRSGVTHIAFGDLFLEDFRAYGIMKLYGSGLKPLFPIWHEPTGHFPRISSPASGVLCVPIRRSSRARLQRGSITPSSRPAGDVDPCGGDGEFHTCVLAGRCFASRAAGVGEVVERDGFLLCGAAMKIHLVDGTCELFRSYFGAPEEGRRRSRATLGLLKSLVSLLSTPGVTHVACAFDHVIESFRNDLFPGYKTSEGVATDLLDQFPLAERAVAALGIVVWPMVEFEADDALATGAARFKDQPGVEQVVICSPDKDLAQAVSGVSVVCWDRRRDILLDEEGVIAVRRPPPYRIGWPWSATQLTAIRAPAGEPGRPSRCWRDWTISSPSRGTHPLGLPSAVTSLVSREPTARRFLYRHLASRDDVPLQEASADLEGVA
jgi:hypothetical protein